MADIADVANETLELELAGALRARRPEGPAFTGFCLFCNEPMGKNMRWCDSECRDAWQDEQKRSGE
jgi:hypothetical protein